MGRNLPAHVQLKQPARIVHYPDPVQHRGVVILHTAAEVAAFRAEQAEITNRQRARLAAIAERDRKARRFWLGFGAIVGGVFLAAVFFGGWLVWTYLAALGLGVLAIPAMLLLFGGLAVGGHRCITIVQHMH